MEGNVILSAEDADSIASYFRNELETEYEEFAAAKEAIDHTGMGDKIKSYALSLIEKAHHHNVDLMERNILLLTEGSK